MYEVMRHSNKKHAYKIIIRVFQLKFVFQLTHDWIP